MSGESPAIREAAAELRRPKRFLTFAAMVERGIFGNRMTLKRAMDKQGFPRPYKLGERRVGWDEAEVDAWLASRRGIPPPKPGRKAITRQESFGASYSSGNP